MTEVTTDIEAVLDYERDHHRVGYEEPDDGEGEQSAFAPGHAGTLVIWAGLDCQSSELGRVGVRLGIASRTASRGSSSRNGERSLARTSPNARATSWSIGALRKASRSSGLILRPVEKSAISRWCGPRRHANLRR